MNDTIELLKKICKMIFTILILQKKQVYTNKPKTDKHKAFVIPCVFFFQMLFSENSRQSLLMSRKCRLPDSARWRVVEMKEWGCPSLPLLDVFICFAVWSSDFEIYISSNFLCPDDCFMADSVVWSKKEVSLLTRSSLQATLQHQDENQGH